jgi:hypothetical protein
MTHGSPGALSPLTALLQSSAANMSKVKQLSNTLVHRAAAAEST